MVTEHQRRVAAETARRNFTKGSLTQHPLYSVVRSVWRMGAKVPGLIVPEWHDLPTFIRGVEAEIGRRRFGVEWLVQKDPSRPFGPGNIRWELRPPRQPSNRRQRYAKARREEREERENPTKPCFCPFDIYWDCPCLWATVHRMRDEGDDDGSEFV